MTPIHTNLRWWRVVPMSATRHWLCRSPSFLTLTLPYPPPHPIPPHSPPHPKALGVPVSPFIDDVPAVVLKHKSIEGGMGIFFYKVRAHTRPSHTGGESPICSRPFVLTSFVPSPTCDESQLVPNLLSSVPLSSLLPSHLHPYVLTSSLLTSFVPSHTERGRGRRLDHPRATHQRRLAPRLAATQLPAVHDARHHDLDVVLVPPYRGGSTHRRRRCGPCGEWRVHVRAASGICGSSHPPRSARPRPIAPILSLWPPSCCPICPS